MAAETAAWRFRARRPGPLGDGGCQALHRVAKLSPALGCLAPPLSTDVCAVQTWVAGGVLYGSRHWRAPVELRAIGCLGLFGAALLLLAAAPGLVILALLMIPLGLPLARWLGSLSASVQRAVSPAAVTEAFAWAFAVITVGQAAGSAVAGPVIQTAGTSGAFLLRGAAALAGAALGALGRSKFRRPHRSAV